MLIKSLPPAILNRSKQLEMPVLYAQACKALEACATMDEGKYYADKADALAAWAKIYGSDEDSRAAARLKLKAYARMGALAEELRPSRVSRKDGSGMEYGARSLLMEHGLSEGQSNAARKLSSLPASEFEEILKNPVAPTTAHRRLSRPSRSENWNTFGNLPGSPTNFLSYCRRNDAGELAKGMNDDESIRARAIVREAIDWLDEFERCLPK